jgi:hypothetical protein
MNEPPTQGAQAGTTGRTLEALISQALTGKGFTLVSHRDYRRDPDHYGSELLLTGVPYESIYGHTGRSEFVLRSARYDLHARIECKWQQANGSVDEKFPYVYLNAVEAMPEHEIFIVADGGGAKAGSLTWLRQVAAERRYLSSDSPKQIHVMSLMEFIGWANRTLR